jgi:8-oxo-dGTP pyrophosphatase MutT (NUDIX family)
MNSFGAGILPVCEMNGVIHVLLARDRNDSLWSDFGGKCESSDRGDVIRTAVREMDEESLGIIGSTQILLKRVKNSDRITHKSTKWLTYTLFVVGIPYMPWLRNTFHLVRTTLQKIRAPSCYLEKSDIRFIPLGNIFDFQLKDHFACTISMFWPSIIEYASKETGVAMLGGPSSFGVRDFLHMDVRYDGSPDKRYDNARFDNE